MIEPAIKPIRNAGWGPMESLLEFGASKKVGLNRPFLYL